MEIGIGLIILIIIGALLLLSIAGWGLFWLLVQLGVIVNEARKPAYTDTSDYSLKQGRDVGKDEQHRNHTGHE